ncbi:MAG: hypothetical protein RIT02_2548 [Planctomycetota bacterium]|jgi:hypothetical protein
MRKYTLLNRMASIAACVGMLLTGVSSAFEGNRAPIAKDVEISARGTLQGQVLTPAGTPIANAPVRLAWQGTPVAETKTTAEGRFVISGVRSGVHELSVGSSQSSLRLWKNGTAPANSLQTVSVTENEQVVRGQFADGVVGSTNSTFITIAAVAGVAVGTTALVIAANNDDESAPASP